MWWPFKSKKGFRKADVDNLSHAYYTSRDKDLVQIEDDLTGDEIMRRIRNGTYGGKRKTARGRKLKHSRKRRSRRPRRSRRLR